MNKKAKVFFAVLVLSSLVPTFANAATYTVVKGDSLYTIGQLFGTTSGNLMAQNGLKSTVIYPGQKLEVPATVYTVQKGDSLYLIAKIKRYGNFTEFLEKGKRQMG